MSGVINFKLVVNVTVTVSSGPPALPLPPLALEMVRLTTLNPADAFCAICLIELMRVNV